MRKMFDYDIIRDSVLAGDNDEENDIIIVEKEEFTDGGKYQSRRIIFAHNGKYYYIEETRSGSYFSEYHYEDHKVDPNNMIELEEIYPITMIKSGWSYTPKKTEYNKLLENIETAKELLYESRDLMDSVHLYESETFKKIGNYLFGEEE